MNTGMQTKVRLDRTGGRRMSRVEVARDRPLEKNRAWREGRLL